MKSTLTLLSVLLLVPLWGYVVSLTAPFVWRREHLVTEKGTL